MGGKVRDWIIAEHDGHWSSIYLYDLPRKDSTSTLEYFWSSIYPLSTANLNTIGRIPTGYRCESLRVVADITGTDALELAYGKRVTKIRSQKARSMYHKAPSSSLGVLRSKNSRKRKEKMRVREIWKPKFPQAAMRKEPSSWEDLGGKLGRLSADPLFG